MLVEGVPLVPSSLVSGLLISGLSRAQGANAEVRLFVGEAQEVVPHPFFRAEYPTAVSFQTTGCGLTAEAKLAAGPG